jgi:hypothetical protein
MYIYLYINLLIYKQNLFRYQHILYYA